MLAVTLAGLLASNIVLKQAYDKVDKNDVYWTFGKVLEQPFKYLKIEGGNITNIVFEQSPNCSVRVLHDWQRVRENPIEASVKNDTLYIRFTYISKDEGEKNWLSRLTLVRIFSPELLYVNGFNTNLLMEKLNQKSISVNLSGKSKFEVESSIRNLDTVNVIQKDSSEVVFEMSPEFKLPKVLTDKVQIRVGSGEQSNFKSVEVKSPEAMSIQSADINLQGYTLLDLGHAQIKSLKLNIADSSGIILSGGTLRTMPK